MKELFATEFGVGLLELHYSFGVGLFAVKVLQCSKGVRGGGDTLSSEEPDIL